MAPSARCLRTWRSDTFATLQCESGASSRRPATGRTVASRSCHRRVTASWIRVGSSGHDRPSSVRISPRSGHPVHGDRPMIDGSWPTSGRGRISADAGHQLILDPSGRLIADIVPNEGIRLGKTIGWGDLWWPSPVFLPDGRAFRVRQGRPARTAGGAAGPDRARWHRRARAITSVVTSTPSQASTRPAPRSGTRSADRAPRGVVAPSSR